MFLVVFTVTTAVLGANGWLALRLSGSAKLGRSLVIAGNAPWLAPSGGLDLGPQHVRRALMIGVCALGLLVALFEMSQWDLVLTFLFQVPYGQSDPVFGNDIGFYLFSLPAYIALKNWALTVILSVLVAGAVYAGHGQMQLGPRGFADWLSPMALPCSGSLRREKPGPMRSTAICCCTATMASWWGRATPICMSPCRSSGCWSCWPSLQPSCPGPICGSAPTSSASCGGLVFGELSCLARCSLLVQRLIVKPNELELERPYIQRNIT